MFVSGLDYYWGDAIRIYAPAVTKVLGIFCFGYPVHWIVGVATFINFISETFPVGVHNEII